MPNIGYETIGGTTRTLNGSVRGLKITMTEGGAAGVTITARVEDAATGDSFRAAVINGTDNQTVLAESTIRTDISTANWYTFSGGGLATFTPANGTTYIIVVASNSAADANIYHDGAAASPYVGWVQGITAIDPLTPNGALSEDATRDFSIYMTYTTEGGTVVTLPAVVKFARGRKAQKRRRLG